MSDIILEMQNISKSFPGVKALDNVNFRVKRGEIHCLVGENGAGKSTLMKVLSGIHNYGSYEGDIILDGEVVRFYSIRDSENMRIAIINQELALVPDLSVAENIYFGHEILKKGQIDWHETIVQSRQYLDMVSLKVNPQTKISDLRIGSQQLVEIAKALSKNAKLMILDEPTSSLNEAESENLLNLLRELNKQGVTIIMISHRLKEVISIADSVTVLRDGVTITTMNAEEQKIQEIDIIKNMVGREMNNIYPTRNKSESGEICFEVKNWTAYDPMLNREILNDINFNVRKGEIVGISGLMGAGRTELALSLFGNNPNYQIQSGEVIMDGKQVKFSNTAEAIDAGFAYATEDRKKNGLVLIQDIRFNTTFANLKSLTHGVVIDENEEVVRANELKESINIKAPSIEQKVINLSGGNQQKVVLAKWVFANPKLLILDEPTRGIDVGAKYEIYSLMNEMVEQGMSIIMISSELLEILGMSDRIYVMSEGKIAGELDAKDATEEKIMLLATNAGEGDVENGTS